MKLRAMFLSCLLLFVLAPPGFAQMGWCANLDYVTASAADGMITVTHMNALYNCCPDSFAYAIDQEGNLITVMETEILSTPCSCLCCYNLPLQIGPVSPGQYQTDFAWNDYESGPRHLLVSVEVPGAALLASSADGVVLMDRPPCMQEPPAEVGPPPLSGGGAGETGPGLILSAGAPNPARSAVSLWYQLARSGRIELAVFSAGGARVRTLAAGPAEAGRHQIVWNLTDDAGRSLPAGAYFCRLRGERAIAERRLIVLR
jgi:hypothetical protein